MFHRSGPLVLCLMLLSLAVDTVLPAAAAAAVAATMQA
jgi:hypothetical protein